MLHPNTLSFSSWKILWYYLSSFFIKLYSLFPPQKQEQEICWSFPCLICSNEQNSASYSFSQNNLNERIPNYQLDILAWLTHKHFKFYMVKTEPSSSPNMYSSSLVSNLHEDILDCSPKTLRSHLWHGPLSFPIQSTKSPSSQQHLWSYSSLLFATNSVKVINLSQTVLSASDLPNSDLNYKSDLTMLLLKIFQYLPLSSQKLSALLHMALKVFYD